MEHLTKSHDEEAVVLVSHADVIKAAICHILGVSTDNMLRFEVSPASISTVALGAWGAKLLMLNEVTA